MRILLSVHDIRDEEEEGRITLVSRDIRPHPDFNLNFLLNDIALVRVSEDPKTINSLECPSSSLPTD